MLPTAASARQKPSGLRTTMTEQGDVLARLEILWRKLEDEGLYVRANTVFLAIEEIKRLRIIEDARK